MSSKKPRRTLKELSEAASRLLRGEAVRPTEVGEAVGKLVKAVKTQNALMEQMAERLERIDTELATFKPLLEKVFARVKHVEPGVQAVLRRLHLDPASVPYPERLTTHRFRLYSQNQEDGITLELLARTGIDTRRFIELGSGLSGGNSAVLAAEMGWSGLMVDGDEANIAQVGRRFPTATAVAAWITVEGVNDLIARNGFAGSIDLLSIDLDGNDYWIWDAITVCSPRLVIVEYNSIFGPDRAVTIPYDPEFHLRGHRFIYYGASLAALARLAARKGYRLVATAPSGINAYFVRNDLAPEVPGCPAARAFRLQEKYDVLIQRKNVDIYQYVADAGLPLVEIE